MEVTYHINLWECLPPMVMSLLYIWEGVPCVLNLEDGLLFKEWHFDICTLFTGKQKYLLK